MNPSCISTILDNTGGGKQPSAINADADSRPATAEFGVQRGGQWFDEIQRLATRVPRPFDEQPEQEAWAGLPPGSRGLEGSCSP